MRACNDFKQLILFQKQGQEWRRNAFLVIAKKAIYKDRVKYCQSQKKLVENYKWKRNAKAG